MSLLACGGMLACTNEDVTGENDGKEGTTSYMAVNIMTASGPGSRTLPSGYEEGSTDENAINAMRFYLFNSDRTPYTLTGGTNCVTASYSEDESNDQTTSTVEEVGNAVLVINGSTATPPASVVAILNYTPAGADEFAGKNLTELKAVAGNYGATGSGNFIMSNSVYNDATTIGEVSVVGKVEKTAEAAKANPVEIYVERVVAKVTVADGRESPTTAGTYLVSGTEGNDDAVYAVINGWQVADYNKKSYILKNITSSWTDTGLGFSTINPWSSSDYHRSFWATSVTIDGSNTAGNYSWNNINKTLEASVYTQENTGTTGNINAKENKLTKVIVAATLKKKDGSGNLQPTEIYKLYGADYASEEAVLTEIAGKYASTYFTRTGSDPSFTYTSIAPTDLEFKTAADLTDSTIKSYYVVAQLKSGTTVYKKSTGDSYVDANTECNAALKTIPAQVWKEGKTYYYTTIKHLGSTNSIAEYGVVRNHIYEVNIDAINGLGTPVYDPTEEIVPVTPGEELSYIAARINILAWRVVSSDVTLGE